MCHGLDLSTEEAVAMLTAISVPRPAPHPCLGERVLLVLGLAWAHHLRACFPVDLLALLKWKAFPDRIMDILGRLRHVSGEEIVKVWLPLSPMSCAACVPVGLPFPFLGVFLASLLCDPLTTQPDVFPLDS